MVGIDQRRKVNKRKAKTPYSSPPQKTKFRPKYKWLKISCLEIFLGNIILGIQLLYIRPHVPVDITRVFFSYFRFSGRKTNSTIQLRSKNLIHFTNLISFIIEIICFRNTAKILSDFTNFPANMFLFSVRKKHLHCTSSKRLRTAFLKHFVSKYLYISVYPRQKIFVPVM